jgi:hypothetical protein
VGLEAARPYEIDPLQELRTSHKIPKSFVTLSFLICEFKTGQLPKEIEEKIESMRRTTSKRPNIANFVCR